MFEIVVLVFISISIFSFMLYLLWSDLFGSSPEQKQRKVELNEQLEREMSNLWNYLHQMQSSKDLIADYEKRGHAVFHESYDCFVLYGSIYNKVELENKLLKLKLDECKIKHKKKKGRNK